MPHPTPPLDRYRSFSASTVETLESTVQSRLGGVCLAAPPERPIAAIANCCKLPSGEIWFCSYGEPVTIRFAEADYLRVQFHHAGPGATRLGRRTFDILPERACVSAASAVVSFGPGFQQLVWRVNRTALTRKLAAMAGAPVHAVEFDPELDLRPPRTQALLGILHSIVHGLDAGQPNRLLLAELEQSLMVSLLVNAEHSARRQLMSEAPAAAPRQVRLVEEYIEANLDVPLDIEQVAALTGCSVRTLYRTFQRHRGYSPAEFSKHRRLLRARTLLRETRGALSVTRVAELCGFSDLSHFSRDYLRAFGESPSATRR